MAAIWVFVIVLILSLPGWISPQTRYSILNSFHLEISHSDATRARMSSRRITVTNLHVKTAKVGHIATKSSAKDVRVLFLPSMNLDYMLVSHSQIEWYEGDNDWTLPRTSPSIPRLIPEMRGPNQEEYITDGDNDWNLSRTSPSIPRLIPEMRGPNQEDDAVWDMLNIQRVSTANPVVWDARKDDVTSTARWHISLSPSSSADAVSHPKTAPQSPSKTATSGLHKSSPVQSPSLYSDSDSEEMDPSLLEKDLPQFVLDCPRKPVIIIPLHENLNVKRVDDYRSVNVSNAMPLLRSKRVKNAKFDSDSLSIKTDEDSFDSDYNAGQVSIKEQCRDDEDADKGHQRLKSWIKRENADMPSENNSEHLKHISLSPLKGEARKRFDMVDKCLLSTLVPVLKASSLETATRNALKRPSDSVTKAMPQYDEAPDLLSNKKSLNSKPNYPANKQSSLSSYKRKEARICVVPVKCEGIEEIKPLKDYQNQYLCLRPFRKKAKSEQKVTANRSCPKNTNTGPVSPDMSSRKDDPQSPIRMASPNDIAHTNPRQSARLKIKKTHSNTSSHQKTPFSTHLNQDIMSVPNNRDNIPPPTHQNTIFPPASSHDTVSHSLAVTASHVTTSPIPDIQRADSIRAKSCYEEITDETCNDTSLDSTIPNNLDSIFLSKSGKNSSSDDEINPCVEKDARPQTIESQGFVPHLSTPGDTPGGFDYLRNYSDSSTSTPPQFSTQPFTPALGDLSGELESSI